MLGDMCSPLAEVPLLQALNDRDPDVRLAAARSLGRLRPRTAAGPLLYALVQGLVPRAVAANALISIGAAALPGIRNLLDDDQPAARANAVELLGRLGNPRDSLSLRERLGDDAPARTAARVRGAGPPRRRRRRRRARGAARETTSPTCASRPRRRSATVGDERSAPTLLRLVHHDCVEVAEVAARALAAVAPALVEHLGGEPRGASAAAPRRQPAAGGCRVRTMVEVVGLASTLYALALNLTYLLLWPLARRGMTRTVRRRSWAWHEEAFASPLTPGHLDRRAGLQRGDGHPRVGVVAARPALLAVRGRARRRRLDRRDRSDADRRLRPAPGLAGARATSSSTSPSPRCTAAPPRTTSPSIRKAQRRPRRRAERRPRRRPPPVRVHHRRRLDPRPRRADRDGAAGARGPRARDRRGRHHPRRQLLPDRVGSRRRGAHAQRPAGRLPGDRVPARLPVRPRRLGRASARS